MISKYRGRSISEENKGQWVYGNLIVDGNSAYIVNGVIECNDQYITIAEWYPVDLETAGEFTGVFDEEGNEIFEGDIVHAYSEGARLIGVIEYLDSTYCIKTKNSNYNSLWVNAEHYEVIGNIYQHPDLVED